ncbi:MAG: hypothetical protein ACLRXQ_11020 [Phascolarctobacterium faecium]
MAAPPTSVTRCRSTGIRRSAAPSQKSSYLGKVNCLALGLERGNYTHLNPMPLCLSKGDILWIIGTRK